MFADGIFLLVQDMTFGVIQRPWENLDVKSDEGCQRSNRASKSWKTVGLVPQRSNFMVVTAFQRWPSTATYTRQTKFPRGGKTFVPHAGNHHQLLPMAPLLTTVPKRNCLLPPVLIIHHIKATDSKLFRWFLHISHVCIVSCGCVHHARRKLKYINKIKK